MKNNYNDKNKDLDKFVKLLKNIHLYLLFTCAGFTAFMLTSIIALTNIAFYVTLTTLMLYISLLSYDIVAVLIGKSITKLRSDLKEDNNQNTLDANMQSCKENQIDNQNNNNLNNLDNKEQNINKTENNKHNKDVNVNIDLLEQNIKSKMLNLPKEKNTKDLQQELDNQNEQLQK